ncbi:hypothetical protein BGX34_001753, partial [Mortierella sp. NVP85]
KFLPSLNQIFEKDICPSLKDFQLSGTSGMDLSFLKRFHDENDDEEDVDNVNDGSDTEMEVDSHPLMDTDGFNDDFGQDDPFGDQDDQDDGVGQDLQDGQDPEKVEDAFEDLDEQIAIQRAGLGAENNFAVDSEEILIKGHPDMYSYFDSALLRNWAGPDHWKLRRIAKDKTAAAAAAGVATGDGTVPAEDEVSGPKKRSGKTQLFIDFVDAPEVDEDELFAPADAASLMFTAANEAENRKSKHVLPDDIHFSSKQLLRMFLKPSYIIKSKTRKQPGYIQQGTEAEPFNLTFPDEEFWATHTNNVDDGDVAALTDQLDQTQIYNDYIEDDEDDYGFQDQGFFAGVGGAMGVGALGGLGLDGDGNDYASQLVSQPKRVKATYINYSKTAKKVDVKKLKDNIWKEMTQQSLKRQAVGETLDRGKSRKKANVQEKDGDGDEEEEEEEEEEEGEGDGGEDYVKKEQRFTEIIGGLSKVYPEHKLKEISVPFCFICLLHLANEKNLEIEGSDGLAELVIRQP